jgi:pimeloyl-ACP methyl ester carboxylesterase
MKKSIAAAALAALLPFAATHAQTDAVAETADGDEAALAAGDDMFARDKFQTETIVCPFKGEIKYKPGEITCGLLSVPENREKSRSRFIKLHFVKLAARKPEKWDAAKSGEWKKREDPIVYLTGGPGAQVKGYVKRFKDHGARDVRDMYILEQRGIGFSEDFCPKYGLFDPREANTGDWDAYQRAGLAQAEDCFAAAKAERVDLSGYNTIENARDVEALRRALGFDAWNVWGISYGSILGQAYIKQDGAHIRAVVLDAIVPIWPGAHFQRIGTHYQRDLDLLEQACKDDGACAKAFPDFQKRLKTAMQTRRQTPIEVDAIDTELFPAGKAWFFGDLFGGAPFAALYEQDNYPTLPAFIDALADLADKPDLKAFRALTGGGVGGGPGGFSVSQGMYNAIGCNDGWWGRLSGPVAQDLVDHPEFAPMLGDPAQFDEIAAMCKRYGMAPRPESDFTAVETDIPAVIADGQMDPITPPTIAKLILPGFKNGTYVEFPYSGHGPTRSHKCAGEFITKFFDNPTAKVDTTCPDSIKRPKFDGPLYKTKALLYLAGKMGEDEKKIALPALWGGLSALLLVFGFLIYTFAPIARLINREESAPTHGARPLAWATALLGTAAIGGLGYAIFATVDANELLLLGGLLGIARWFVIAGLAAGVFGLLVLFAGVKARMQESLPIGTLFGLILTGLAGVGLATFLLCNGFFVI